MNSGKRGQVPGPDRPRRSIALPGHAAKVPEQASHIDRTSSQETSHQHLGHSGLRKPPKESPAKHDRDSGQESQILFFQGFISPLRNPARFSEVRAAAMAEQSIKAMIDPKDIAALAVFLASDAGKSISG
jgi:hypothetical protein